jgi:hypothetical protein
MFNRLLFILALVLSGFTASPLAAGQALDYYLPAGTTYDAAIPTPEEHFGFPMGEWHLSSHQLDAYLRAVAVAAPERVRLEIIGRSHEQKPLHLLIITAAENHARLDDIRRDHLARWGAQPPPADRDNGAPVIVSLGYGVHGNEPLLAGYASAANQKTLAGSAAAVALAMGRGSVVALPDDPNFRGIWHGGNRLFLNAVFHGRAIRPVLIRGGSDTE